MFKWLRIWNSHALIITLTIHIQIKECKATFTNFKQIAVLLIITHILF